MDFGKLFINVHCPSNSKSKASVFPRIGKLIFITKENIGTRRIDFLVKNEILVELKAIVQMEDVHLAQGLNYLVAYQLDKGLLINFGARGLAVKRLRHPRNKWPGTVPHNSRESNNPSIQ